MTKNIKHGMLKGLFPRINIWRAATALVYLPVILCLLCSLFFYVLIRGLQWAVIVTVGLMTARYDIVFVATSTFWANITWFITSITEILW